MQPSLLKPQNLTINDIQEKLSLGCPILDSCLKGGVRCGQITEFVGESTAGKTQLCLQLLLTLQLECQVPSTSGSSALYICTEGHFAGKRLQELASNRGAALITPSIPGACPYTIWLNGIGAYQLRLSM